VKIRKYIFILPEAPIMAKNCPGRIVPETSFRMVLGSSGF